MTRKVLVLALLTMLTLSCSLGGAIGKAEELAAPSTPHSEHRCGDGVCDGPENARICPQDCAVASPQRSAAAGTPSSNAATTSNAEYRILYGIVEYSIKSTQYPSGITCYHWSLQQYLDGGYVRPDGSENQILDLVGYPTAPLTSKRADAYYYISTPNDPTPESHGNSAFDWDEASQGIWRGDFAGGEAQEIVPARDDIIPGGVETAPGNAYLVYPLTNLEQGKAAAAQIGLGDSSTFLITLFNPFVTDSMLVARNLSNGKTVRALQGQYNRPLFKHFADFSPDGRYFYTLAREGETFKFVRVTLESGAVDEFSSLYPGFDWAGLNWDEFFPPHESSPSSAYFTLSPDGTRLIAYKDVPRRETEILSCAGSDHHHLWVFNLEDNTLEVYRDREGYVTASTWAPDGRSLAMSVLQNSACSPVYVAKAWITVLDRNGQNERRLVEEPESRIAGLGWSPDGRYITYDVDSTDFMGRIKLVDPESGSVREVINSQQIGYAPDSTRPITLFFADWVAAER